MNPDLMTPAAAGAARKEELSEAQITDLKIRLNQLIWEYSPSTLTLGDADELAGNLLSNILTGHQ